MIKFLGSIISNRFYETPDGLYHGKSDQKKVQNNISSEQERLNSTSATNIGDSQQRVADTTARSNNERGAVWSGYSNLANNGGIDSGASGRLLSGDYSAVGGGPGNMSSSGGGVGGSSGASSGSSSGRTSTGVGADAANHYSPSYLDTYNELTGPTGGFDPGRLSAINNASSSLYDTSGNYGDVNANIDKLSHAENNYGATNDSVAGLQKFAATGGLNANQLSDIQRGSLKEIEQTGGYSASDIANERARANAGVASTYANLKDDLGRQRLTGAGIGPGWSEAGFKLARQGAQTQGTQAQATEAGIHDKITGNRLTAGATLGNLGLGTADLQSKNTLSGYTNAGNLDVAKNTAIQDAWDKAGKLGLGRQAQIDAAKEAAAAIDQKTQDTINSTRLGAAGGLSQDTIGRMSINASSGAAAAANKLGYDSLAAQNQRFLISEADANRNTGLGGMLDTYKASPTDQQFQQNLLRGYNQDLTGANQNQIVNRMNASTIPGIGSTISSGLRVAGQVMALGSGAAALGVGMGGNEAKPMNLAYTPTGYGG